MFVEMRGFSLVPSFDDRREDAGYYCSSRPFHGVDLEVLSMKVVSMIRVDANSDYSRALPNSRSSTADIISLLVFVRRSCACACAAYVSTVLLWRLTLNSTVQSCPVPLQALSLVNIVL